MIRWRLEIDTDFNVDLRIDIEDSEYSGSIVNVKGGDSSVITRFNNPNEDILKKIAPSEITLRLAGKKGDYDDLFDRDFGRFKVNMYVDDSLFGQYVFLPDTYSVPDVQNEDFGNFVVTIKGTSISALKKVKAWDVFGITGTDDRRAGDEKYSVLDGIYKLVNFYFDMNVVDGTVLYPASNTSTSALSQFFFSTKRFNSSQTAFEALEWLITKKNRIQVSRGKFFVFPVLEAEFTGYEYNGSSISSGTQYDENFTAIRIGRVLETQRNQQDKFDGVRRIYRPGESPNIVPSGDLSGRQDFQANGTPQRWDVIQSGLYGPSAPRQTRSYRNPQAWTLRTGFIRVVGTNAYEPTIYQAVTDTFIRDGKQVRFGINYEFNGSSSIEYSVPVEIRIGDYVLIQRVTGNRFDPNIGELEWVLRDSVSFPQNFLIFSARGGVSDEDSIISPPVPETGNISFLVASPLPQTLYFLQILGGFSGFPITGWSLEDFVGISQLSADVADEDGEIIIESEELAGEDGDVYEFVDYFGDGFTSVTPGALELANGNPTTTWQIKGLTGSFTLNEIVTKYLFSELSRDRKRIRGRVDVFDTIALIEGKRVNYIRTDWRYGTSDIELCEISEHDLEATTEERRERGTGSFTGRPSIDPPPLNFFGNLLRIGELNEDVDEERTEIDVIVDEPIRAGYEYWIINESELDPRDKEAGVYPFVPLFLDDQGDPIVVADPTDLPEDTQFEFGPGDIDIKIEEVLITAPLGSIIVEAPGQREIERNVTAEVIIETVERVTITEDEIDAQATLILGVQASIEDLEDDVSVNASAILTLDSRVTVNEDDITAQASAILAIESDITDLENDTSANASAILSLDTRVTQNEDDISSNASAILGVESRVTDAENDIDANASSILTLETDVSVIDGELDNITAKAALVVDAGGTIGSINLAADGLTGFSEIDIQASQVKINQVIFDDEGAMYSDNFNGGIDDGLIQGVGTIGWALDRSGYGVFNDIDVRESDLTDCNFGGSSSIIEDSSLININILSGDIQVGSTDVRFAGMTQATSPSGVSPLRLMANTSQSITGGGNTAYAVYWVRPN